MIRFFCERCGEEMWELVEWEDISHLTLDEVKQRLVCSDCLLAEARAEAAEAEAARLREALEKIVNLNPSNWCASWTGGVDACDTMKLIAQAALSKKAE